MQRPRIDRGYLGKVLPVVACALGLATAVVPPAVADDLPLFETDDDGAYVYESRSFESRRIGQVEPGHPIRLRGCGADCRPHGGFVALEPFGYVSGRGLRPFVARPSGPATAFARITERTPIRLAPSPDSGVRSHMIVGNSIAVLRNTLGQPFAERPNGTYIASTALEVHHPSRFAGEHDPTGTLAFALVDRTLPNGTVLHRYDRRRVDRYDATTVVIGGVALPRQGFRIATRHARPASVPSRAYWVHVDEAEQVLTAYEGDRWVFATLVTTGSTENETIHGTFRVYQKTAQMTMHGDDALNYIVEGVEHVQFFRNGYALHAAYWHDAFGERGSHGCVNLSPADAAFLYAWAPPSMPQGWSSLFAEAARLDRLWITVE